ncbi:MAG: cyclic nucleotide-binding domain-containing protein [Chloroflexota bacterium]|nr:cyclic nucleotide-binding domain-containing protein [Chloroflexota bacterium]
MTFVAAGVLLPALTLLVWRRLVTVDATAVVRENEIALLRTLSNFAPFPAPIVEHVVARLQRIEEPSGSVIIHQGEPGHRFHAIAEGEADVSTGGRRIASLDSGDYFGETALFRHPSDSNRFRPNRHDPLCP